MKRRSWLVVAICAAAYAQEGQIAGPVLGFVHDGAAKRVRPIYGIPASGLITGPVAGDDIVAAEAGGSFALALQGEARKPILVTAAGTRAIAGASEGATRLLLSSDGAAAALLFEGQRRIEHILLKVSEVRRLTIASLRGPIAALAVTPSSVVYTESGTAGIYVHSRNGELRLIPTAAPVTALAARAGQIFALSGSELLVFTDFVLNRSLRVPRADATDLVVGPTAAVLARRGSAAVSVVPLSAATASTLDCDCSVSGVFATANEQAWRLTGYDSQVRLLDLSGLEPRITFVAREGAAQ